MSTNTQIIGDKITAGFFDLPWVQQNATAPKPDLERIRAIYRDSRVTFSKDLQKSEGMGFVGRTIFNLNRRLYASCCEGTVTRMTQTILKSYLNDVQRERPLRLEDIAGRFEIDLRHTAKIAEIVPQAIKAFCNRSASGAVSDVVSLVNLTWNLGLQAYTNPDRKRQVLQQLEHYNAVYSTNKIGTAVFFGKMANIAPAKMELFVFNSLSGVLSKFMPKEQVDMIKPLITKLIKNHDMGKILDCVSNFHTFATTYEKVLKKNDNLPPVKEQIEVSKAYDAFRESLKVLLAKVVVDLADDSAESIKADIQRLIAAF